MVAGWCEGSDLVSRAGACAGGRSRAGEQRLDVSADDPAAWSGPLDTGQINLGRLGHLPRQRAGLEPAAVGHRRGLGRFLLAIPGCRGPAGARGREGRPGHRLGRFLGRCAGWRGRGLGAAETQPLRHLAGILALLGQHHHALAECDLVAGGMIDVHDHPVVVRLHLHRGLVGLDVGQDVAFLDGVAHLHQPLRDHAGFHGGAELGHRHFNRHVQSPAKSTRLDYR